MNIQVILSAAIIVFMVIFIVMMWTIYTGMKKFLSSNIEEALIVSGDYIGERVKDLHSTMTGRMNALQNENTALRQEITRRLDGISAVITDANDKSEIGINSIVKELNYIIPALRDEMNNLLATLSENAETFQRGTIRNFEAEINRFINAVNSSCENITRSANEQSNLLANMAGTVQGVMNNGANNLQSAFSRTHQELQRIITDSVRQIDDDYQRNMKEMFAAMADNLAAITQQLREASESHTVEILPALQGITEKLEEAAKAMKPSKSDGTKKVLEDVSGKMDTIIERMNPPANPETNTPAEVAPEPKKRGRKPQASKTKTSAENPPEVTDNAKEEAANDAA